MRIQVDARMLRAGGIGRYIREITGPWLEDERVDAIRFMGRPEELEPWLSDRDVRGVASIETWRDRPYSPVTQLRWPGLVRRMSWEPHVSFFPHFDVPLIAHPAPSVVTVHDLIHLKAPEGFPGWKRAAGRFLLEGALGKASCVVTVSNHSRHDLLELRPELRDRIRVIPNGVSSVFRPLSDEEREDAEARWGHLIPFVMAMGEFKAHKNLSLVWEVVERVRTRVPDLKLAFAGGTRESLRALVPGGGRTGLHDWWAHVPSPTDQELRELFGLSEAFLFPSLYEGFGLPPLEAAACGTRVLASDRTSLPEVLEGRATLLDPGDADAWVALLLERIPDSAEEQKKRDVGTTHDLTFPTWNQAAADTLEVLMETAR